MSSWQVKVKEVALQCLIAAGKTLADETAQKIIEQIKTNEKAQNIQSSIMEGRGFDAASNVFNLFKGKKDSSKSPN
jgi:hypothetical protein